MRLFQSKSDKPRPPAYPSIGALIPTTFSVHFDHNKSIGQLVELATI